MSSEPPDHRSLLREPTLSARAKVIYLLVDNLDARTESCTDSELAEWVGAGLPTVRKAIAELDERYPGWCVEP